jgi:L-aspartate oxidase
MSVYQFDALIIGCGVAGLSSAVSLAEKGLSVAIVTRATDPNETNTFYAQGGIIFSPSYDESLIEDILNASSGTSNLAAAKILAELSGKYVTDVLIEKCHADFSKNDQGELEFTREAAHSKSRILYKGDYTGKEIQVSLLNFLNDKNRFPNVTFYKGHTAIDLITPNHHGVKIQQRYEENRVLGAYILNQKTDHVIKLMSKVTILATGGVGALYLHNTNSEGARGDGHAMAKRAGASITDMEFIQFHPTTFYAHGLHRRFLISEAVRGEGGILVNSYGEAFMSRYHPDKELAPRDIVARAIAEEIFETKSDCVYLDISHKSADWIKNRFPTIYDYCLKNKIDMTKNPIPVVPAAHYTCGGVKTDLKGRTNLKGLYAVGEVACTGLHGANRLASTSLLEGLTWGQLAGADIIANIKDFSLYDPQKIKSWENGNQLADTALIHQDWQTLRLTMWNYVGLVRAGNRLARAEAMFKELYDEIQRFYKHAILNDELIGLRNAVEVGYMVLLASRRNQESVGCFYRR